MAPDDEDVSAWHGGGGVCVVSIGRGMCYALPGRAGRDRSSCKNVYQLHCADTGHGLRQVVDSVIRRSGCEDTYRAMENCLAFETNRDFKACAKVSVREGTIPQSTCEGLLRPSPLKGLPTPHASFLGVHEDFVAVGVLVVQDVGGGGQCFV